MLLFALPLFCYMIKDKDQTRYAIFWFEIFSLVSFLFFFWPCLHLLLFYSINRYIFCIFDVSRSTCWWLAFSQSFTVWYHMCSSYTCCWIKLATLEGIARLYLYYFLAYSSYCKSSLILIGMFWNENKKKIHNCSFS